jgi:hypothetical protein
MFSFAKAADKGDDGGDALMGDRSTTGTRFLDWTEESQL